MPFLLVQLLYFSSKVTCAFKLKSEPFAQLGCSEEKTIKVKRALARIIVQLQTKSWEVVINTDIAKVSTNSCLFFRKVVILDRLKKERLARDGDIFIFSPICFPLITTQSSCYANSFFMFNTLIFRKKIF